MEKKLLITTALVALVSTSNVYAIDKIVISKDITNQVNTDPINSGALLINYSDDVVINNNINITGNTSTLGAAGGIKALNGFTAGNGLNVSGNTSENKMGGGIYIRLADDSDYSTNSATSTNRKVVIGDNATISHNSSKWLGGGIALESAESVTIGNGAIFEANHSDAQGGAIAVWSDPTNKLNGREFDNKSILNLGQTQFLNNTSGLTGGAIANLDENIVTIGSGSIFEGNTAVKDGGAIYNEGTMTIGNNTILKGNTSKSYGGAIGSKGNLTLNDVIIDYNKAFVGGGLYTGFNNKGVGMGSLTVNASKIINNEAIAGGGAIANYGTLEMDIENTLFSGNKVTGAVVDDGYNNHNLNSSIDGGAAIFAGSSSYTNVNNSKFIGNNSSATGGAISTRADWYSASDDKPINSTGKAPDNYDSSTDYLKANTKAKLNVILSEFTNNTAITNGGAIYNTFKNSSVTDSSFTNNSANLGGAIYNEKVAEINFNGNNIFSNNKANGKLNDIHNIGNINVLSGGLTLDGGISGNGTLTLAKDSNLNVKADVTTISNQVKNNGANLGLIFANGYAGGEYALITNGGTLDNEFNVAENGIYKIETDAANKGTYTISKKSAGEISASTGANANQASAISAITNGDSDSALFNNIANSISELVQSSNKADVQVALDATTALAPEANAAVQSASTENANQIFGAVGSRLSGGSIAASSEGASSGDSIFNRGAMWVQGLFNKSKLDDTSTSKGFDADSTGIAFGAEKQINDDVKAGIGYAYTQTDIDGFMRKTDVDTHTAIVYGEYKPSSWFVNGIATYGWSDYSESKNVLGNKVKADYDVDAVGLQAMTGYEFNMNSFNLTPEAGLRYVNIKQDAYRDSADQKVGSNSSDILTGVIGAKVDKDFALENGMNLRPEARLAMTYDMINDSANSIVTLANGSAYSVNGEALDRFGVEIGAGLTADINQQVEMSLGYEGKFRQDYSDHTGLLNVKYKF